MLTANNVQIQKRDFYDVMKAWCAFSASDINKDNKLSIKELRILLWIYNDEEPSEFKLKEDLKNIDEDKSGTIQREEWLNYLCASNKAGGYVF